ncbi:MAG: M20/M25/M40 family metallo-hydrolase, partial [Bacillota bacterium]
AGLVMMAWAVQALRAVGSAPNRPVVFLVTADEEVGSASARPIIEACAKGAAYALVLEPAGPGGAVKTARKGVAQYRLIVTGRSAHAGNDFWRGINANVALAEVLLAVHALSDRESGTTVNVGVMGGGTRPNVVAERAWADVDVRFATRSEAERIDRAMRSLQAGGGARLEVSGGVNRWPLERQASAALYEQARGLAAELGLELGEAQVGGGSDGNITAELGVPTLDGLGPDGDGAHSASEYVYVPSLPLRTAFLARLLETL